MNTKMLFVFAGTLGIIFLLIFFVFLVFTGKKSSSVVNPQLPVTPEGSNSQTEVPTMDSSGLKSFSSSYFSFSYSKDLSITEGIPNSEGFTVVVNAPAAFEPSFRIAIQVNPQDKVSVPKIKNTMEAFGLKPSAVIIGSNISAAIYSDLLGKRHQEVVLFEKNSYVYRIDLSYYPETHDPKIADYFKQVLSTFKPR